MKKPVQYLLLSLCAAAVSGPLSGRAATVAVDIVNFAFSSPNVTIQVGDTVKWTQSDSVAHTTTSGTTTGGVRHPDGLWDSGSMTTGKTFSHSFNTAGTFPYYCSPHFTFMTGNVIVKAASNAPPAVAITSPTNGASFSLPASVTIEATASDPDDPVSQVEFFDGTTSLGKAASSPYSKSCASINPRPTTTVARSTSDRMAISILPPVTVAMPMMSAMVTPPTATRKTLI